jgi:hypothetical protein
MTKIFDQKKIIVINLMKKMLSLVNHFFLLTKVARFFLVQTNQKGEKCTKNSHKIPNGNKVYHNGRKHTKCPLNTPKFSIPSPFNI